MGEDEREECQRGPEPADLDKVDIEYVALFGKIAGRVLRIVGLRAGEIGGFSARGMDHAIQ